MFVRFGRTIVNLEHITSIEFTSKDITVYTIGGASATMAITGADELEKALAEYNDMKGYKHG